MLKIVVYKFIGENNREFRQAILFYNDGTVQNTDIDTASKEMINLANRNGIKDLNDLITLGLVTFTTGNELSKNWNQYKQNIKEQKEKNKNTSKKENLPLMPSNLTA